MADETPLTDKEELFCQEYCIDFNGTQAVKRAKYNVANNNVAGVMAYDLLRIPKIQDRIEALRKEAATRFNASKERMIQELSMIAYGTIQPLFDEHGKLLKPREWPAEIAGMVASVETEETYEGFGEARVWTGYSHKVKPWDKLKAHDQLAKILGFYAPVKSELKGSLSVTPITGMQFKDE